MSGFMRGEKSPMKNIMNIVTMDAPVVFLVSRKIAEKKIAVAAMVPRCNNTIRKEG